MRRSRKRAVLFLAALFLLTGITVVVWKIADWPPPRLILKYGFPPSGGPTGRTKVIEGIEFVEVSPGYFRMGSHFFCHHGDLLGRFGETLGLAVGDVPKHDDRTCPPRWVEVEQPLWMAATEVTCDQYHRFATDWDDYDYGDRPVTNVTLSQALWFCRWLGEGAGVEVRLPTPEEWEYAASAGTRSGHAGPGDIGEITKFAWCRENVTDGMEQPIGTLRPNQFGLHDMHGNVNEWCADGSYRGGDWNTSADECRGDLHGGPFRPAASETWQMNTVGFRPVLTVPEDE